MRIVVVVGVAVLGLVETAVAADLPPYLRGQYEEPPPVCCWAGVYGGGQISYSAAGVDFGNSTARVNALVADTLHATILQQDQTAIDEHLSLAVPPLGKANAVAPGFGGFVGYNWQWEDAVTGVELNYTRASLRAGSTTAATGSFFDSANLATGHNNLYDVMVTGSASAHITDWATLRARGGWAAGRFLPYAFLAVAVGRFDLARSASGTYSAVDSPSGNTLPTITCAPNYSVCPTPLAPTREARNGVFAYGGAAGLGLDIALLPNVFVRGEWEWTQFAPVEGLRMHISTVRTALGLKF